MVVGTEVCEIYDTGLCLHLFIDAGLTEDPTIMHDFSNAESLLQNSSVSLLMDYWLLFWVQVFEEWMKLHSGVGINNVVHVLRLSFWTAVK